jgi:ribonucleoside-diphosphate reductase alpha chain
MLERVTSNGFVRNKLTVLHGGAGKVAAAATALLDEPATDGALALATATDEEAELLLERIRAARIRGYEGDSCSECGNFTLVRNGTCLKCDTCGATSGCS